VALDELRDKRALGHDVQRALLRILQPSLGQGRTDSTSLQRGWHLRMCEGDEIIRKAVGEERSPCPNLCFEAMLERIVGYFQGHRPVFLESEAGKRRRPFTPSIHTTPRR
jgi:hypothetical protein